MNMNRRDILLAIAAATGAVPATAQDKYPNRPVSIVVPFPAGGVVDLVARTVGPKMAAALGAPVVVENKAGAGGTIGAAFVSKAKPDGYTLLLGGSATQVFGPALYKKLQYDAKKDFTPVGQISSGPLVLVTGSKVPATDVPQLTQYLKAQGVRAFYGSNGNGTFPQLAAELFKQANQLPSAHIPYSGGPGALTALIAGDIAYSINHIPVVQGMVKSGKLRALATTGRKRSVAFPNLPTLDEAGMKGFEANAWWGLFAPAGTSPEIVQALNEALAAALKDPAVRTALEAQGDEVSYSTPKDFAAFVNAESTKWTKVVKTADLQLD
ncbi:Bug family tripartite tricarboxylate transporter substrate binding protein [Rubrivivax rivuli]|uniref:Tripartite tricarboxylate transporter substrate binding protein n=1 Tax=Rubrivivax rivuli TaxID=1862385 RepID=A0A437RGT0_9BURK|nr:tripartite tricarboxylate transporter substrate-binding protein [Rubrivivax rivuli]RVU45961.1 tripartite tricarboxylate transporter substrate binding protein [Rubrivivax rivuli]